MLLATRRLQPVVAPVVFSSRFKFAFAATWKASCSELRDCFTRCTNPQLSQLVVKCEIILYMASCVFDERARGGSQNLLSKHIRS